MEDTIHDCYVSVAGKVPSNELIEAIYNRLPDHTKQLAARWDWNDTEVRDGVYRWIRDNLDEL